MRSYLVRWRRLEFRPGAIWSGHRLLILILLAHIAVGTLYSVVVPPWEAHDEIGHYAFVRHLATERRLPPPGTKVNEQNDESHQPPLYYVLTAAATAWIKAPEELHLLPNPRATTEGGYAGVNMVVHDPAVEGFPYRGAMLALHAARLVSVALSTLGLIATYGIGRQISPASPEVALGATAIHSFWPQYVFIGSVVTNDIMVTVCASWFFLFLIRTAGRSRLSDWLGMGLSLGAALLSKNNGLILLPVAAIGAAVPLARRMRALRDGAQAGERRALAQLLGGISAASVGLLALAGWWYARNMAAYGQVFGHYQGRLSPFLNLLTDPASSIRLLSWGELAAMLRYGFLTFWASFGWGNMGLPSGMYLAAGVFCTLGAGGLLCALIRDRQRRLALSLLSLAILSFVAIYVILTMGDTYLRGRISLPIITPVSVLLAVGWSTLLNLRWPLHGARRGMGLVSIGMAVQALLLPFLVIAPAYARPPRITAEDIAAIPYPLDITFCEEEDRAPTIALLGYDLGSRRMRPGEELPVTLYWQALRDMAENYTLAVKIIGPGGAVYGARHLFPGRGNFATSLWKAGDSFRETYRVPIEAEAETRVLAQVSVSFFRDDRWEEDHLYLPAYSAQGSTPGTSVLFGRIKIAGSPPRPTPSQAVSIQVGDHIALVGYDLAKGRDWTKRDIELTLYWEAQDRIAEDYTVFVHLTDGSGGIAAQADAQPVQGNYPTSLWEQGEVIADPHHIHVPWDLPSGTYTIVVGLYSLDTLARLPALASTGEHLEADAIAISQVDVMSPEHWVALPLIQRSGE